MRIIYKVKILLSVVIMLMLTACSPGSPKVHNASSPDNPMNPVSVSRENENPLLETGHFMTPADDEVLICAAGDIMVHESQWIAQTVGHNAYDFRNNFKYVRDFFVSSDLSIGNLETTINRSKPVATYPRFNSPHELADGIAYAGLNLMGTANNHSMDTGYDGIIGTIDELKKRNLDYVGTRKDPQSEKYMMKTIKGMKLGIAAFSTAYFNSEGVVINNIKSSGMEKHINYMELTSSDKAFEMLKPTIHQMKKDGAEFIILILHWGTEYEKKANAYQKTLAQLLINEGVGLILGSHPHMVQEMEFLRAEDGIHEGLVVYSMGNFLSNQRNEILKMNGTEDGIIPRVILHRDTDDAVIIRKAQFIPTWVSRIEKEGNYIYEIIPIGLDPIKTSVKFKADVTKITESLQNTLMVQNDPRITQFDFLK